MTNKVINLVAFVVLGLLWLAFFASLIFNPQSLETAWQSIRSLPFLVQLVVWLLTLPVMIGVWVWQTSWPVLLRLVVVLGLALVTMYTFYPWKANKQAKEPSSAPAKP